VVFTIIKRYVIGEVLRAFLLALVAMTAIFVLFMVVAEAMKFGASPADLLQFVPYVVPSTLPFTIPVSLLFAVTVVYGRLASDNEIVAIKTSGVHPLTVLWPAYILGAFLSVFLLHASATWIPRANSLAKVALFKNSEEMFYKFLRRDHELKNPRWPFLIMCRAVEGKTMIDATFKHRASADSQDNFDAIIQAKRANIKFDYKKGIAHVYLDKAEVLQKGKNANVLLINDNTLDIPMPEGQTDMMGAKKMQEWTDAELSQQQRRVRVKLANERKRQSYAAALWIASGRIQRVPWKEFQTAFIDYNSWISDDNKYETEKQFRHALAFGSLFFVLLGAPVGIRFARRDFLSAFISCFMPIILLYYPLTLMGINLGKEGVMNPLYTLWAGNCLLGVLTGLVLPPIIRH
jgi:lipopolysaccharide export system permease protein